VPIFPILEAVKSDRIPTIYFFSGACQLLFFREGNFFVVSVRASILLLETSANPTHPTHPKRTQGTEVANSA